MMIKSGCNTTSTIYILEKPNDGLTTASTGLIQSVDRDATPSPSELLSKNPDRVSQAKKLYMLQLHTAWNELNQQTIN